eukprot:scaffold2309_cov156-Isochrysis_galbana.AAC.1
MNHGIPRRPINFGRGSGGLLRSAVRASQCLRRQSPRRRAFSCPAGAGCAPPLCCAPRSGRHGWACSAPVCALGRWLGIRPPGSTRGPSGRCVRRRSD